MISRRNALIIAALAGLEAADAAAAPEKLTSGATFSIRGELVKADPAGQAAYEANAKAYLGKLDALEQEVRDFVARIPADRRRIITTHDAFGYFRDAYGLDFIAPQGVSTESEVSAKDVARIITQIRRQKITAVFSD